MNSVGMMKDDELAKYICSTLKSKCHLKEAVSHYNILTEEIESSKKQISYFLDLQMAAINKNLESAKRLDSLYDNIDELTEILGSNDEEFTSGDILDESFDMIGRAADVKSVDRSNLSTCLDQIKNLASKISDLKFIKGDPLVNIGVIQSQNPFIQPRVQMKPLPNGRIGRGRGRIPHAKIQMDTIGIPYYNPSNDNQRNLIDPLPINGSKTDENNPNISNITVKSDETVDSFAAKPVRPDSPEKDRLLNSIQDLKIVDPISCEPSHEIQIPIYESTRLNPCANEFNPFGPIGASKLVNPNLNPIRTSPKDVFCKNFTFKSAPKSTLIDTIQGDFNKPMGISANTKYIFISDTLNHKVLVFDHQGRQITALVNPHANFDTPTSILPLIDGKILVKDNNQIHVFDSSSNENKRRIPFKRHFGKGKIKRMSCGLMLNNDEIRVISDNYKILTFCFSSGEYVSETVIDTNHDFPGGKLPKIRFARNHQNTLYLADMANFCILITDTEGVVKNIIGREGFGIGHFKQPAGLTFDADGNLLAIDSKNNRILCFSADGEAVGELLTIGKSQKPKRPSDCFLIDQNSLFVIALDGTCYIYKLTL